MRETLALIFYMVTPKKGLRDYFGVVMQML
jgi:hypothetical protein